jgi:CxxC motif-containing protein (DUF1111 family)
MPRSPGLRVLAACAAALVLTATSLIHAAGTPRRPDLSPEDAARVAAVTAPAVDFTGPEQFEIMAGGAGTSTKLPNRDAFSQPAANLAFAGEERFKLGNALFRKQWVAAPASTKASDGLGPLYNARACQNCHLKDGRGHPPAPGEPAVSLLIRLARPAVTGEEKAKIETFLAPAIPDDTYGGQLQTAALPGVPAEGNVGIAHANRTVELGDGTTVTLRAPVYEVSDPAYGPLDPTTTLSPRIAPPMIGMGLIEAIHPADLAALTDPEDRDGDGVSGRMARAKGHTSDAPRPGRFGWKAQSGSVREQAGEAFAGDIGISTPDLPHPHGDCTDAQPACIAMPTGEQAALGEGEAPDEVMDLVTFYSANLAVPARRDVDDPDVLRGKELFYEARCTACHAPKFVTRRDAANPAHAFQLIWPYSDFLLHDMGPALADGQRVGAATGREWRTPPLWGIGLTETVSGHTRFLHDGRARSLEEAILWHGGEAEASRTAYADLPQADRDALIRFLESL